MAMLYCIPAPPACHHAHNAPSLPPPALNASPHSYNTTTPVSLPAHPHISKSMAHVAHVPTASTASTPPPVYNVSHHSTNTTVYAIRNAHYLHPYLTRTRILVAGVIARVLLVPMLLRIVHPAMVGCICTRGLAWWSAPLALYRILLVVRVSSL